MTFLRELTKFSFLLGGLVILVKTKFLILGAVWGGILYRSKFFYVLMSVMKQLFDDVCNKLIGRTLLVPGEALLKMLRSEKNLFAQYLFNPFGTENEDIEWTPSKKPTKSLGRVKI